MFDILLDLVIGGLIGGAVVGAIAATISYLDKDTLKNDARRRNANAFKAIILDKKTKKVNVGLFNRQNENLGEIHYDCGSVSSNLHKGDVIYL